MVLSHKLAKLLVENKITVQSCISFLEENKLTSLLPTILRIVKNRVSKNITHETLMIESPFNLSSDSIKKIKRIIGNDLAVHKETINPKLLAGFRARFKGTLYDASAIRITEQLNK